MFSALKSRVYENLFENNSEAKQANSENIGVKLRSFQTGIESHSSADLLLGCSSSEKDSFRFRLATRDCSQLLAWRLGNRSGRLEKKVNDRNSRAGSSLPVRQFRKAPGFTVTLYVGGTLSAMSARRIVIPGGTGQVGQMLADYFHRRGDRVTVIARRMAHAAWQTVLWNGRDLDVHWVREVDGADIVINLAGRSVNCRYNKRNRREIKESRVQTTHLIEAAIAACTDLFPVLVVAALFFRGDRGKHFVYRL